jgi:hypothetical protein
LKNKTLGIYQRKTNDRYFKNSFQTLLFGVNGGLFSCVFFLLGKSTLSKHIPTNCPYNHAKIAFDIPF